MLLAFDQGTTSARAMVFDTRGTVLAEAREPVPLHHPRPGWVEQDAEVLWSSSLLVLRRVLEAIAPQRPLVLGLANQRETTLLWERATGRPVAPAIVWQDRRTAPLCERLRQAGMEGLVRERTGLLLDPYFSATKLTWLLENIPGVRQRALRGELAFGTVDSYLLFCLSRGQLHATDTTNACRTALFNIHTLQWDMDLLRLFDIPEAVLPEVRPSTGPWGTVDRALLGWPLSIGAVVGDQQAALAGQGCLAPGMAKSTYGTGAFLVMNTGPQPRSHPALLTTIGYHVDKEVAYALEGSMFVAGAAVQWLVDLGILREIGDAEYLASSVPDSAGVIMVPALSGLACPHWDPQARGILLGLSLHTTSAHVVRATLEGIAWRTAEVIDTMADGGAPQLDSLRVDGGACGNAELLQIQADALGVPVVRPAMLETTVLGAALLAGVAAGVLGLAELGSIAKEERRFVPQRDEAWRRQGRRLWTEAVARCRALS
jgi:glycerol kinase